MKGKTPVLGEMKHVEVGIKDGIIRAVGKEVAGRDTLDLGDKVIIPGAVDLHVHLREPGPYGHINIETETRGALLAGVTTVFDMPNNEPPVDSPERYYAKAKRATGRSYANIGFYYLLQSDEDFPRDLTPAGFKVYLAPSTGGHRFDWSSLSRIDALANTIQRPVMFHPEDPALFDEECDRDDLRGWGEHRSVAAEKSAVRRVVSSMSHSLTHLCHISSVESFPPGPFSFESTYHHLLFDHKCRPESACKVLPPLRTETTRVQLFEAFVNGKVPVLASDHAPHPRSEKKKPFAQAPSGISSLGAGFPVMLAKAFDGEFDLTTLLNAACRKPAEVMGLKKGALDVGMDADLVVVDPETPSTVPQNGLSGSGWSPLAGMKALYPQYVFLKGKMRVEDNRTRGPPRGETMA